MFCSGNHEQPRMPLSFPLRQAIYKTELFQLDASKFRLKSIDWDFFREIGFGRFSSDRAPKTNAKEITKWYSTARARRRHIKIGTYPVRLSAPASTIILPTHRTITPPPSVRRSDMPTRSSSIVFMATTFWTKIPTPSSTPSFTRWLFGGG